MVPSRAPVAILCHGGLFLRLVGVVGVRIIPALAFEGVTATAATVMLGVAPLLASIQLLVNALIIDMQESGD